MSNASGARSVVLIASRVAGHAAASGYDRLQDYLRAEVIRSPVRWSLAQRSLVRALLPLVKRSGSQWYHRQSLLNELQAAGRWVRRRGQVFHFLYGENGHRYLGHLQGMKRGNAIVCTYHTPERRFAEVVGDRRHLARLDAAIAVSTVQLEFLGKLVGRHRVHYVPHGIDVDYFKPLGNTRGAADVLKCLFVGSHLRDVDTLAAAARSLESCARLRFVVVTSQENAAKFTGLRNVEVKGRVDDTGLLDLYQQSDLLVFPLIDCTANNSLLEAMAAGLPIVSTDLVGVRDYVTPECAILVGQGKADRLSEALLELENRRELLQKMGLASRERALEFRWEDVAERTQRVYDTIS